MSEAPQYRPKDSAHNTAQPWGQHNVIPYSLADEVAWAADVARLSVIRELPKLDAEGLDQMIKAAREEGDIDLIRKVEAICFERDGWDETDASFFYLAQACQEAISFLEGDK